MSIDMEQFKATYIEESVEGLDIMESNLLNLEEGSTDEDSINAIFRAAHSIKGGGATFGFTDISNFTHVVETLLDEIRNGERNITREAIDLFLQSVDVIRALLNASQNDEEGDAERTQSVKNKLERMLDNSKGNETNSNQKDSVNDNDQHVESSSTSESGANHVWKIEFSPFPALLSTGNDVVRMFRELEELGDLTVIVDVEKLPALVDLNAEECHLSWMLELNSNCEKHQIADIFVWVEDDCDLSIELTTENSSECKAEIAESAQVVETETKKANPGLESNNKLSNAIEENTPVVSPKKEIEKKKSAKNSTESSSIRVDIEKIDALINMVGELVITQSMLSQLGEDFDMNRMENMLDGLSQLERNTRELQESVMRIRMIPISFAFNRFPRMIHDMCAKLDKKVELKVSGESTELDKTVMEKIGDPLVHLVRNSMDHGIEMPKDRKAAGKPESGTVHLNAFHQGGNIVIEIIDDGAGLNKEKIVNKALKNGLIESSVDVPDSKVYDLIFQPGFSTADAITDVSGRGVGMDVVKRNIHALGGTIEVKSEIGVGTSFIIRLPLTLAILDGQLIRVGDQTYIIPLISIIESLQVEKKYVNAIGGKAELYKLRDEYIPVIRFYQAFNIEPDSTELDRGLLVVVEGDGQKAGLLVDDLLAQQQVVIKSLETNFKRVGGLSGATILGDGTVALIVDVAGVIRVSQENTRQLDTRITSDDDGIAA